MIDVPPREIESLRERLGSTRWPAGVANSGGFTLDAAQQLTSYWLNDFDWYTQQAHLNAYPHALVAHRDTRLHVIHSVAPHPNALPLLLLHGWPGSFVEFWGVIDRLRDSYHLIVPSLPGFGFSPPATAPGMSNERIADLMAEAMTALGYERFGVHGGDVGAGVATWLAFKHASRVAALHLNFIPGSYSPPLEPEPSEAERSFLDRRSEWAEQAGAYSHVQRTRPLTLAYGLSDSPVGLAVWIAEKFSEWADPAASLSTDTLLTNIMIYWLTNSIGSSVRLYLESSFTPLRFAAGQRIGVPTAIAHFPFELPFPPRSWVERVYNVQRWTEMSSGGHFAALEVSEALSSDIAAFFAQFQL